MRRREEERLGGVLRELASLLLDEGAELAVETIQIGKKTTFLIRSSCPGALLGRNGSTISALRTVVGKVGARLRTETSVEVDEFQA